MTADSVINRQQVVRIPGRRGQQYFRSVSNNIFVWRRCGAYADATNEIVQRELSGKNILYICGLLFVLCLSTICPIISSMYCNIIYCQLDQVHLLL